MFKQKWAIMRLGLLGVLPLAAVTVLFGQGSSPFPVIHYKLRNGLEVILSEDFSLPLVSVAVAYNVGSIHEPPGKTGLAYLMENLMFSSGSANIAPFQHFNFINHAGGQFNGVAAEDKTLFYQTVPSNQLGLVLWLESDRMMSLDLNEASFEQQRSYLLEDLSQRRVNEPYFESFIAFDQWLYSDFAHSHSLLGSEDNIRNLTLEDVKSFYSTFYVPNNAVLCITGNFNARRTRDLVARYFETIPPGKDVSQSFAPQVYTKKPIVASFVDRFAAAPAFHMGFRMASPISNDYYTLTIIDYILFRARSSRLIRRLLNPDNKIAYQVSGGIEKRNDRVTYKIFCVVNTPGMGDQCQNAIFSELDKLKKIFISDDDLARYKTVFRQDYLGRLSTSMDKAIYLCESYLSLINFDDLPLELEKFMKVSPNDIIPFVNRYFTVDNSVILNVKTR